MYKKKKSGIIGIVVTVIILILLVILSNIKIENLTVKLQYNNTTLRKCF